MFSTDNVSQTIAHKFQLQLPTTDHGWSPIINRHWIAVVVTAGTLQVEKSI